MIMAEKAFKDDWFNRECNLNITKPDLIELLAFATKNQLFQFQGNLYEQVDGVTNWGLRSDRLWPILSCAASKSN